jgi:hypothetical protein
MCRKDIQAIAPQIPSQVWTTLWEAFAGFSTAHLDPMKHVRALGDDMEAAGIAMDPSQEILYMEALYVDGNSLKAIDRWERFSPTLDHADSTFKEYWELGVRMFANYGQPIRAQNAANVLINSLGGSEARILVPIIKAWLLSGDDRAAQRAWALYVRMKHLVADGMDMRDYDAVVSLFLSADQTALALGVFKDMMLTGDPMAHAYDSVAIYTTRLSKVGNLNSADVPDSELSWEKARPLTTLPKKFRNKFFYGSWIKKLIGEENIDGAAQVIQLMASREICPDARHTNGLIGAWFREGSNTSQAKAEELAWRMIRARLDFVKLRTERLSDSGLVRAVPSVGKQGFLQLYQQQLIPMATIETFAVLLEHYRRRNLYDRAEDLYVTVREAKIRPTTAYLNQQLLTYIRSRRKQKAWVTYNKTIAQRILPDMETFSHLWTIMKNHVDPVVNRTREGFPEPRTLFAEMTKWTTTLSKEELPRELYDMIILSFGLADDQVGTAVALRALQRQFGLYPTDDTARSIVLQLAKAGSRNLDGLRPRRLNLNSSTKTRIYQVTKVLQKFKQRRAEALLSRGVNFDDLEPHVRAEEALLLLSDTLRFVFQTRLQSEVIEEESQQEAESAIACGAEAAAAMAVPDCNPWKA